MRRKPVRILVISLALFLLILCTGLGVFIFHIGPRMILQPHRISVQQLTERYPDGFTPDAYGLRAEAFDVQAEPDILLCGWFVHAKTDAPTGTVILLHGIGGCKEQLLGLAKNLAASGLNCILYDSRAQGRSGGQHCTFGYYEKRDVSACIDEAQRRYGRAMGPFAVFGNSFGGAVALQSMAIDKRICCGVVESTFATLREVTYDYMLYYGGTGLRFVSNAALWRAGRVAGFDPDDVQPEIAARQITQPILLAHGEKDECISIEYGRRIFANLASQDKAWFAVPDAGHDDFADVAGEEHQQRIVTFLRKHMMARLAAEVQR